MELGILERDHRPEGPRSAVSGRPPGSRKRVRNRGRSGGRALPGGRPLRWLLEGNPDGEAHLQVPRVLRLRSLPVVLSEDLPAALRREAFLPEGINDK